MSHLMYSPSNETLFSRAALGELVLPEALGSRHRPVGFKDFTDLVVRNLTFAGFDVEEDEYAVSADHNRFFGMMQVSPRADRAPLEGEYISKHQKADWSLNVGVRGSHDQSIPRGLTLGSSVMVCSNLCFHGDLGTFQTRQTTHIWDRLPALVQEAISQLPAMAEHNQIRFDAYKDTGLNPRQGDAALVELTRRGALTPSQLGRAINEWDRPSYEEHAEHGHTAWRLFNAATEALKPTGERVNMELVRSRSEKVSNFLDEVVGL